MRFKINDGGKSTSKRKKQRNDCSVRAVAITFNLDYDYVYDTLAKFGRKCGDGMYRSDFSKALEYLAKREGRKVNRISFPAEKGKRRMSTNTFIEAYKSGNYILNQAGHFSAVCDGVSNDLFTTWGRCVYSVWEIK